MTKGRVNERREQRRTEKAKKKRALKRHRAHLRDNARSGILPGGLLETDVDQLKRCALDSILTTLRAVPDVKPYVGVNAFPKMFSGVMAPIPTAFTDSLPTEITWAAATAIYYATTLHEFVAKKVNFERTLLHGELDAANDLLNNIATDFGVSMWLIESKLLVAQLAGQLEGNRQYLAHLTKEGLPRVASAFAQLFSQRVETNVSVANFGADFDKLIGQPVGELRRAAEYLRFRVHFQSLSAHEYLAFGIYREAAFPVIDRYLHLVRALQVAITSHRKLALSIAARLNAETADTRLVSLNLLATTPQKRPAIGDDIEHRLLEASDLYSRGEYRRAADLARESLVKYPECLEFYELYSKSCVYLNAPDQRHEIPVGALSLHIVEAMLSILRRDDRMVDSLAMLRKIAAMTDSFRLSAQLLGFVAQHEGASGQGESYLVNYGYLNASSRSPRLALLYSDSRSAEQFLNALSAEYTSNAAVALFATMLNLRSPHFKMPNSVSAERAQRYKAYALLNANRANDAAQLFREVIRDHGHLSIVRDAGTLGLCKALLLARAFDECATLLADTYIAGRQYVSDIPLGQVLLKAEPNERDLRNIAWPILTFIHKIRRHGQRETREIYVALDDFLQQHGMERPSSLAPHVASFDRSALVFLLRYVCVPETLSFSIAYHNSDELELERISVCQLLRELDGASADVYTQEISRLTQAGMVRKAVQHLAESKVHVDTVGLRRSLDKPFRERFDRYVSMSQLTDDLRKALGLKHFGIDPDKVVIVNDLAYELFRELFSEIGTRFISSNDYGLDSYLSIRVRHGTLSGQLRSVFEVEKLITARSTADGVYDKNEHWAEELFNQYGPEVAAGADGLLRAFSRRIDDAIDKVKREWIQIKGPSNHDRGLFDFDYTEPELFEVYSGVRNVRDYEEFLNKILAALWSRTEDNLRRVVVALRRDLQGDLTAAIDTLAAGVAAVHSQLMHSHFGEAIVRCRTQIQNGIEAVAGWFRSPSESSAPDFDMSHLMDVVEAVLRNTNPTAGLMVNRALDPDARFRGVTMATLVHILLLLLENVVKHSKTDVFKATVSSDLTAQTFRVVVTNMLGTAVDLVELRARAEALSDAPGGDAASRAVRSEGGSGYFKLRKLIAQDLDRGDDYAIHVQVESGPVLRVAIEMAAKGLTA